MGIEFTMLEDIPYVEETKSGYARGMSYTVRPPEQCLPPDAGPNLRAAVTARCEALAALVPQWIAEGKAIYGRPSQEISGFGG